MASPDVLEFERLLKPISEDRPCGNDLRKDTSPTSLYHGNNEIKDRRKKAGEIERKVPDKEKKQDDFFYFRQSLEEWRQVDRQARVILAEQSKDLEVVTWLIEALVRLHGFAGLRDGFRLACELIERYWDQLYPLPDPDDTAPRAWPLVGLNGFGQENDSPLARALWRVPLTETSDRIKIPPLTWLDYKTRGDVESAVKESSPEFFSALRADLTQCQEYFAQLCRLVDENLCRTLGKDKWSLGRFPSSHIKKALNDCREAVRELTKESEAVPTEETAAAPGSEKSSAGIALPTNLTSREKALQTLIDVANYFERTEPHSPLPSLLKQAVRWARMSYAEWLNEVITNDSVRTEVFKLTGIRPESK